MRKMKYIYIMLTLVCVLQLAASCKKDIPPHGGTVHHSVLNIERGESGRMIEDMFCDFELIPLENRRECMVGNCMKVVVEDRHIYLWDVNGKDALLSFNMDGSFHCKIGDVGHSKSEYTYMKNFAVNREEDSIALLDYDVLRLYDGNGKFIGTKDLEASWDNMLFSTRGLVLGSHYRGPGMEHLLQIYDIHSGGEKNILPVDSTFISYPPSFVNMIQQVGDTVCFFDFLSSTLFLYDVDNPDDAESIELHTEKMLNPENAKHCNPLGKVVNDMVERFVYTGNNILGVMSIDNHSNSFVVDVKKKKAYSLNFSNGYCDFDCYHNGWFYSVWPSSSLLEVCQYSREKGDFYKRIRQLVEDGLSEQDNIVIVRARLKR